MNKKKLGILMIVFYLLYTNGLSLLPISIFNLDFNSFSINEKILYFLITDVLILLILFLVYRKDFRKDLIDFKKNFRDYLDYGVRYWILGLIAMAVSNVLIQVFITNDIAQNEEAVRELIELVPLYMLFASAIYAPLVEETIFRKSFRDIFGNTKLFVIFSGLTFGALHVLLSMESFIDLFHIIPYSCLGVAFAMLYVKTNNIFSSIAMHVFHNTLLIVIELIVLFT